jgi:hypothetical protein
VSISLCTLTALLVSSVIDGIATAKNCDPTVPPAKRTLFTNTSGTKKPHRSG